VAALFILHRANLWSDPFSGFCVLGIGVAARACGVGRFATADAAGGGSLLPRQRSRRIPSQS
jgi:hypothetical protein